MLYAHKKETTNSYHTLIFIVRVPGETFLIETDYHLGNFHIGHCRWDHFGLIHAFELNEECKATVVIGCAQYLLCF